MLNPKIKIITDAPAEELETDFEEWKEGLGCDIDVQAVRTIFNFTMNEYHLIITYREVKDGPE